MPLPTRPARRSLPLAESGPVGGALHAHARFDEAVAARTGSPRAIACKEGCSHCCRGSVVDVLVPEALAIVAFLRASLDAEALATWTRAIAEAARRARSLSDHARHVERTPCVFLDATTSACRIYPVRPLTCRGLVSYDAAACEHACTTPDDDLEIPIDPFLMDLAQGLIAEQADATAAHGHDAASYELVAAVDVALRHPDAAQRWLAAERVFEAASRHEHEGT